MTEPTNPLVEPIVTDVNFEEELKVLQEGMDPSLKDRVGDRFRHLMEKVFAKQRISANEVLGRIAKKHGYNTLDQFEKCLNLMLKAEAHERAIPHLQRKPKSPQLARIHDRINRILADFQVADEVSEIFQKNTLRELLNYSVEVEDAILRAEKSGQLDPLTGFVRDRDAVTQQFEIERRHFLEAGAEDEVMLWVEIDIDDFKILNSQLGHNLADAQIIKPLATRLKNGLRTSDVLCRLGGDEFSLILNRVKKTEIPTILDRIKDLISTIPYETDHGPKSVTASIGALVIEQPKAQNINTTTTDAFMSDVRHKADVAADQVKQAGKNNFKVYTPDAQAAEASEAVYVKDFLRRNIRAIQELRDLGDTNAADQLENNLINAAKTAFQGKLAARDAKL